MRDTSKNIAEYEEIQNFTETPVSKQVETKGMEIKKLREENRKMKIELTAIKNVIKRYMTKYLVFQLIAPFSIKQMMNSVIPLQKI